MVLKKSAGFTLIELMIVVAIVGILAAIALPQFLVYSWKAQRTEAILFLKEVLTAESAYFAIMDHYVSPDTTSGVVQAAPVLRNLGIDGALNNNDETLTFQYSIEMYFPGNDPYPGSVVGGDAGNGFTRHGVALSAVKDIDGGSDGGFLNDFLVIRSELHTDFNTPAGIPFICIDDITENLIGC